MIFADTTPPAPEYTNPVSILGWMVVLTFIVLIAWVGRVLTKAGARSTAPGAPLSVQVPTMDGGTVTHRAEDTATTAAAINALAVTVSAMQTRLAGQAAQLTDLNAFRSKAITEINRAHDHVDDIYDGFDTGRYPPLPQRLPRPDWLT